ncbi:MAG: hypothetical protein RRA63_08935 [Candidatus Calescibacterium sp.]|jgi:hypothetical protein|nr:hypothetical protein [Candidatus Calescibacterium sp.]
MALSIGIAYNIHVMIMKVNAERILFFEIKDFYNFQHYKISLRQNIIK